jgi:hypothetical protein
MEHSRTASVPDRMAAQGFGKWVGVLAQAIMQEAVVHPAVCSPGRTLHSPHTTVYHLPLSVVRSGILTGQPGEVMMSGGRVARTPVAIARHGCVQRIAIRVTCQRAVVAATPGRTSA